MFQICEKMFQICVGMMLQEQKANIPEFCTINFYICGITVFSTVEKDRTFQTLKGLCRYFQFTCSVLVWDFISWLLFFSDLETEEWEDAGEGVFQA